MKLKPRMKKIIAMFLIALTINTSIFSSAVMPVQASTIPLASELVAALLSIFGYTYGYGTTLNGSNNTSSEMFAEMQAKWNAGESFEVDGTEIPDLRVAANFTNFVYDSYDIFYTYCGGDATNEYFMQLNEKSYKATGTLVTKTYLDALTLAKEHVANTAEDVLTTEIDTFFSAVTDDDVEIQNFNSISMYMGAILAGIAARSQINTSNTWTNTLDTSVWNESDLYQFTFDYNGITIPCYMTSELFLDSESFTKYIYKFSRPVYVMSLKNGSSSYNYIAYGSSISAVRYYLRTTDSAWQEDSISITSSVNNSVHSIFRMENFAYPVYDYFEVTTSTQADELPTKFYSVVYDLYNDGYNPMDSISAMDTTVSDAMSAYSGRAVTKSALLELADALDARAATAAGTETATAEIAATITEAATAVPEAGTSSGSGEYSSILDKILAAISALATAIWSFFSEPLTGIKSVIDVFPDMLDGLGEKILTIPKSLWDYFEAYIANIEAEVSAIAQENKNPWENDDTERSSDSVSLLNGFVLLIFIIIELLKIFWHCLQFIVAIFEIQPSTAFLPDEVIMGLDYLKTLEITGIGLSVYDFLMGLVYILIVFSVVRVLRINIDRIHVPGHGIKKAS